MFTVIHLRIIGIQFHTYSIRPRNTQGILAYTEVIPTTTQGNRVWIHWKDRTSQGANEGKGSLRLNRPGLGRSDFRSGANGLRSGVLYRADWPRQVMGKYGSIGTGRVGAIFAPEWFSLRGESGRSYTSVPHVG